MKLKSEHALLGLSVLATLAAALLLIRWLAPQLLGVPADLRLVSVSKEIPPFFEGVFRAADAQGDQFILPDPLARVRARPFLPDQTVLGPHDVLGFRNFMVPRAADVVVIGDSQTYGNNARLEDNWPSQMAAALPSKQPVVYAMATGGWAATQYLQMVPYALRFRPKVVVVAFYAGNDAAESFVMAYGAGSHWQFLKPDAALKATDMPASTFKPAEDVWRVVLPGGRKTAFTAKLRLVSNDVGIPAVKAGWGVMAESMRRIVAQVREAKAAPVVVMIPTKELAYAPLLGRTGQRQPADYARLVSLESENIRQFGAQVAAAGAVFVDATNALQQAALQGAEIYPDDENGHPVADGYGVIASAVFPAVDRLLPPRPLGLYRFRYNEKSAMFFLITDEGAWIANSELLEKNGWGPAGPIPDLPERELATIPMRGLIPGVDKARFGPQTVHR